VADHPDATLVELCELFAQKTGNWVSQAAMCRCAAEIRTHSEKKLGTVAKLRQKEFKN
jgi:putative transposase